MMPADTTTVSHIAPGSGTGDSVYVLSDGSRHTVRFGESPDAATRIAIDNTDYLVRQTTR